MSDGGIGGVAVSVVPDATDFWRRFEAATSGGATEAGRNAGRNIRAGIDEELAKPVDIKVNANTAAARAEIKSVGDSSKDSAAQVHLLRDAIVLLGPAALPVAGVLGGAFVGAIPALAALALGIKGISEEMKSGALAGTQYGRDLDSVKTEFEALKTTAANGLLPGVAAAIEASHPLFQQFNRDVGDISGQIGQIAAGAAPALLNIFDQLQPLFTTFGTTLVNGAQHLEQFASSSTGITSFVAYVQAELPQVEQFLGNVTVLVSHLAQSFAPFGGVILGDLALLVHVLDAIPVDVLRAAVPPAVALYAAFRSYAAVNGIVSGVSGAYTRLAATFAPLTAAQSEQSAAAAANARFNQAAAAAATEQAAAAQWAARTNALASLQIQAAAAEEAAGVAAAKAVEAEAWATLVAAAEDASAALVAASQNEALAAQEAAAAAVAASVETAAAATAMAEEIDAAGVVASAGWKAALGPVAALAVGVAVLTSAFLGNHDGAQKAAAAADSYAQSVQSSTDAMSSANIAQTNKNLSDKGALKLLSDLASANKNVGVSNIDLALAVNGTGAQYDSVTTKLKAMVKAWDDYDAGRTNTKTVTYDEAQSAKSLINILGTQRAGLQDQILTQTQLNQLNAASIGVTDSQAAAGARLFGLVGTSGVSAYLAAQQAAQKNTQQTQAQTLAWQLANDAGSLLQQTLDKLSGKTLSYAQADNQFQQQLITQAKNLKGSSKALDGLGESAISNRGDLLQLITSAEATAKAYGDMKGSSVAGRTELAKLRQQIIDNAHAHGEDLKAVTDYVDSLLKIPKTVPPTKLDADKTAAEAKIKALQDQIASIKQNEIPNLDLHNRPAEDAIAALQAKIDALRGKTIPVSVVVSSSTKGDLASTYRDQVPHGNKATGGLVEGPGTGTSDQAGLFALSDHEFVSTADSVGRNQAALEAGNRGAVLQVAGKADGGIVTLDPTKPKASSGGGSGHATYVVDGKKYASTNAADNAEASLIATAKNALSSFAALFAPATSQISAAASALLRAAEATGMSARSLATVSANVKKLNAVEAQLDPNVPGSVAARLGTAPSPQTAYDRLATAEGNRSQFASSASSAVYGSYNLATATPTTGKAPTFNSLYAGEEQAALLDKRFTAGLQKLAKEGLDSYALQEFAAAGPSSWPQVQALLQATPAQIKKLASVQIGLDKNANTYGSDLANTLYGASVTAAKSMVNGLKSQEGELAAEAKKYAEIIEAEIRKGLDMHSPSRKLTALGALAGMSFVGGWASTNPAMVDAVGAHVSAMVPIGPNGSGGGHTQLVASVVTEVMKALPDRFSWDVDGQVLAKANANGQLRANRRNPR